MLTTGHSSLDDRIFYKQALSLRKKYEDIFVIAPDDKNEYIYEGIKIIGIKKPQSLVERFKIVDLLIEKAIEVKADVYHFHDFEIIYKVGKLKKHVPTCKIVYDVHEHYPDMVSMSHRLPKLAKPLLTYFVDKSEKYYSRKFDFIITADDAVKERFLKFNNNVEVIYNFSEFAIKDEPVEKQYDVIYQGGITLARGVLQVVRAIKLAKERIPDIKMIFVGPFDDPKGENMVNEFIEENNLKENIRFIGKVPHNEVESFIRKSKIGVVTLLPLPKYYKNIPIKQFEYMSCGIPVIGSNLPPIEKFINSYNSGIIVNPEKPEEIAQAMVTLLEDDKLRERLGNNGVKAVTEAYNWSNMEKCLFKIYKRFEY